MEPLRGVTLSRKPLFSGPPYLRRLLAGVDRPPSSSTPTSPRVERRKGEAPPPPAPSDGRSIRPTWSDEGEELVKGGRNVELMLLLVVRRRRWREEVRRSTERRRSTDETAPTAMEEVARSE